jgi:hypothetical protein
MQPDTELQAKQDVSQVHDEGCWLRDEEAAGSNPATPTQLTAPRGIREKADSGAVQQQSTATAYSPSCLPSRLSARNVLASDTSV